jgi:hypothetical protein
MNGYEYENLWSKMIMTFSTNKVWKRVGVWKVRNTMQIWMTTNMKNLWSKMIMTFSTNKVSMKMCLVYEKLEIQCKYEWLRIWKPLIKDDHDLLNKQSKYENVLVYEKLEIQCKYEWLRIWKSFDQRWSWPSQQTKLEYQMQNMNDFGRRLNTFNTNTWKHALQF